MKHGIYIKVSIVRISRNHRMLGLLFAVIEINLSLEYWLSLIFFYSQLPWEEFTIEIWLNRQITYCSIK